MNGRTLTLKWHLVLLVAAALLPVVLFAVVVVHRLSLNERAASERRLVLAARNLTQDVEREISTTTRTLQALAASERLDKGDFKAFYNEARRTVQTQPTWVNAILLTPDGQQIANTNYPFGVSLPKANEPESLRRVVQTHQPTVGYLVLGSLERKLAFPVRVPVMRSNKLQYVLTAVIAPQGLASVIKTQTPVDGEWTRTILDGRGVVVARVAILIALWGSLVLHLFSNELLRLPRVSTRKSIWRERQSTLRLGEPIFLTGQPLLSFLLRSLTVRLARPCGLSLALG